MIRRVVQRNIHPALSYPAMWIKPANYEAELRGAYPWERQGEFCGCARWALELIGNYILDSHSQK